MMSSAKASANEAFSYIVYPGQRGLGGRGADGKRTTQ